MLNLADAADNTNHEFLRRGADAVDVFCNKLNEIRDAIKKECRKIVKIERQMKIKKISEMLLVAFYVETDLKKSYKTEKGADKSKKATLLKISGVRDHCRSTDRYRGCARSICNSYFSHKHLKIPVFFQNTRNYDEHLVMQNAEKLGNQKDVLAQNSKKFINSGFDSLSVMDSFRFTTASFDKLVSMTKYDKQMKKVKANGY